jgi:hypothetical protein
VQPNYSYLVFLLELVESNWGWIITWMPMLEKTSMLAR